MIKLDFQSYFSVDAKGRQDGLTLLWNPPADINILKFSDHFITVEVYLSFPAITFMFTGIYGESSTAKK